jgi:hypothetical protein
MTDIDYYFMITKNGADLSGAVSGGWDTAHASHVTGDASDLDGLPYLWPDGAAIPSGHLGSGRHTMPWPGGFCRSVFRVARDPFVGPDSDVDPPLFAVSTHDWVLAERLAWYLQDQNENVPAWPLPSSLGVVGVTGTPVVDDGDGWYGMMSLSVSGTWDASEMVHDPVPLVCDRLVTAASGGGGNSARNSVAGVFDSTEASMWTAQDALYSALGAAGEATQRRYWGRVALAMFVGLSALGTTPSGTSSNRSLQMAVQLAMEAIHAKELGLVGETFTSTHYETLSQPIDAVIAMPSGY